jgi:hypothetical protein
VWPLRVALVAAWSSSWVSLGFISLLGSPLAERISFPFDYVVQGAGRGAKSFLVKHARP